MTFTDEELEVIQTVFYHISLERPLSDEEKDVYFKITNA